MTTDLDPHALLDALRRVRVDVDDELRAAWDRSLPFGDATFDRWERAARLGFAEGASIYDSALVYGSVSVGERTWIGPNVLLDGSGGGLRIGAWCSISAGTHVYTHDTVRWSLSQGAAERHTAAVSIGDATHLGAATVVAAGSRIGSMCVVGAGSFVKGDVPDRTVVAGAPARPVGVVVGDGEAVEVVTGDEGRRLLAGRGSGA